MINLDIENFRGNIANLFNSSKLPIGIKYYVLKDLLTEASRVYEEEVNKEIEENNKADKEE